MPKRKESWHHARVKVFSSDLSFESVDPRRTITGVVADFAFPFPLRQIKLIETTASAMRKGMVIGNHRHIADSGQWEIVVVLGSPKVSMFSFRYKNHSGRIGERELRGGDVAIIPPGCTLAFRPLHKGARLLEISNQEYDAANYIEERLF